MTFQAQNNNITVTDTNGDVVFNTGTPMPHIVQTITSNVTHQFPESGDQAFQISQFYHPNNYGCPYQSYECTFQWNGSTYENVCNWVTRYYALYVVVNGNRVLAKEDSQTYTLGTLTSGTNPDFLLARLNATRTVAGSQHDYGTFVSAIPSGQEIAANGSTILESAFRADGEPWLSRLVTVYLDGDAVKAEFKHSNRQYDGWSGYSYSACQSPPGLYAPPSNTSSTWSVTFNVYAGKFTT